MKVYVCIDFSDFIRSICWTEATANVLAKEFGWSVLAYPYDKGDHPEIGMHVSH